MSYGPGQGMTFATVGGLLYASLVETGDAHELLRSLSDDQRRQARLNCGSGSAFVFLLLSVLVALISILISRTSGIQIIEPVGVCYAVQLGVAGVFVTGLTFLKRYR